MKARRADPRDIAFIEEHRLYRVYFSDRAPDAGERDAGSTDEWELSETDLGEVLAWISANEGGRAWSLYTGAERGPGKVLVHLMSRDRDGRPAAVRIAP